MKLSLSNRRRSQRDRRGAALVEAALVLPVVLMFLFGILEYGRYIMMRQVLTNAAREGARYAQIHQQPLTVGTKTSGNTTTDVTNQINIALAGQKLSGQSVRIYTANSQGIESPSVGWNDAQNGQSVCVEITGNYPVIVSQLLFMNVSIPVTAKAVMRTESN